MNKLKGKELVNAKEYIAELEDEITTLKQKAAKWDALDEKIAELYDEDSDADLGDIGEVAAIAFGYL